MRARDEWDSEEGEEEGAGAERDGERKGKRGVSEELGVDCRPWKSSFSLVSGDAAEGYVDENVRPQ